MSDEKKRRLTILPEVLPAPQRTTRESAPRERTRGHLQRILSAALVASTAGMAACKDQSPQSTTGPAPNTGAVPNGPGYVVVDPIPPPAVVTRDAGATPTSDVPPTVAPPPPPPPETPPVDAGTPHVPRHPPPPRRPPPPPPGYGVVDPMPSPARRIPSPEKK